MHGCCLGDTGSAGNLGNIPWGYLGQDTTSETLPPGAVGVDAFGDPIDQDGNVLNPDGSVYTGSVSAVPPGGSTPTYTAGQLQTVANGGSTGNASTDAGIAQILSASGSAAQAVLKQIQLGQIASNTPLYNTALQAAIISGQGGSISAGISSLFSQLTANPVLLLGALAVGFMVLRKR